MPTERLPCCTMLSEACNGWKIGRGGRSMTAARYYNTFTNGLGRVGFSKYSQTTVRDVGDDSVLQSLAFFSSNF